MFEIKEFTWRVHRAGYCWAKPDLSEIWGLGLGLFPNHEKDGDAEVSSDFRLYKPLRDHRLLYRVFASTPITLDAILEFANTYGLLGEYNAMPRITPEGKRTQIYEPLTTWQRHIEAMTDLIEVWDALQSRDEAVLARYGRWVSKDRFEFRHMRHSRELVIDHSSTLGAFTYGQLLEPSTYCFSIYLSHHLAGRFSLQAITKFVGAGDFQLWVQPESLIGALWLQFAWAVARKEDIRQCGKCEQFFALSPDVARADKLFCSDRCRMKAYRDRQAQARALSREGASIEDIAKKLDSDPATVLGWLTKSRRRKGKDGEAELSDLMEERLVFKNASHQILSRMEEVDREAHCKMKEMHEQAKKRLT